MKNSNLIKIEYSHILSPQALKKIMGGSASENQEVCKITCSDGKILERGCQGGQCRKMGDNEVRCLSTVGARYTKFALTCSSKSTDVETL